jgi:plasmid maintenance system antidote protein VapI
MLPTNRPPTHPGEIFLKEFLEGLGVSQIEAARRMKIPFERRGKATIRKIDILLASSIVRIDAELRSRALSFLSALLSTRLTASTAR